MGAISSKLLANFEYFERPFLGMQNSSLSWDYSLLQTLPFLPQYKDQPGWV
jgi:hypothetical protein